jgi:hypothetical protein
MNPYTGRNRRRRGCGWDRLGPRERAVLAYGDSLDVSELLDEFFERLLVEIELPPQHPEGHSTILREVTAHLVHDLQKIPLHSFRLFARSVWSTRQ